MGKVVYSEDGKLKRCGRCKKWFAISSDNFRVMKNKKLTSYCKSCEAEYKKENYVSNKDYILKRSKKYYENTRESRLEYFKELYTKNRSLILNRNKLYRVANKEKLSINRRIRKNKRRALERNASGDHTSIEIEKLYQEQDGFCYWCDRELDSGYHVDHVIPLSRGGTNFIENIVISCPTCNLSKGSKLPSEWTRRPSNNYGED